MGVAGRARSSAPRLALVVVLLCGVALAGCGGDDESATPDSVPPAARDATWPQGGRDDANTRANDDEVVVGVDTVADLEERWRIDGLDGVTSTPAVVDGVVYVGDFTGALRAIDAENGDELWSTDLDTSLVYSSPAVHDDRVYVGDQSGNLHAVAQDDGTILWTVSVYDHPISVIFGSPVVIDDPDAGLLVVVGVGSGEIALPSPDFAFRGNVVAYSAETGQEVWRVFMTEDDETSGAGVSVWSSPAVDPERGVLYVGTGNTYEEPASPRSDAIVAIDVATGEVEWVHQFTEGDVYNMPGVGGAAGPDADVGAVPNLFTVDERDLVGVGDKAGVYTALDRDTGEEVWRNELTLGSRLGGVIGSAAYSGGTVFVASNVGDERTQVPSGTVVLAALDAATGETRWDAEIEGTVFGPTSVANGVVFQGTTDGVMYGFDAESGDILWEQEGGGDIGSGPSIVDGTVYWGFGFWVFERPQEPAGGLVALSPD